MHPSRVVLVAVLAGAVCTAVLLAWGGAEVCVAPAVCAPPLPGGTGCGPVPTTCSGGGPGPVLSSAAGAAAAVLIGSWLALVRRRTP